jgi:hypothetical protein
MNTSPLSIGKSSNFIWALVEGISGRSMVAFNEIGHLAVFFSFPLSRWWYPKIQWFQNLIFPTFSLFQTPPLKDFPSEKWSKLFPGRSAEVSCWYIHNFAALALRGVPRSGVPWGDTNSILPGCQNGQPKWLYGVIWYYMMFYVALFWDMFISVQHFFFATKCFSGEWDHLVGCPVSSSQCEKPMTAPCRRSNSTHFVYL